MDAIQHIPTERWPEVLNAIENLKSAPPSSSPPGNVVRTGADLRGSDLIGIWANRPELDGSRQFADQLRQQSEQRGKGPSNAAGH